jgi:hypothetical protein
MSHSTIQPINPTNLKPAIIPSNQTTHVVAVVVIVIIAIAIASGIPVSRFRLSVSASLIGPSLKIHRLLATTDYSPERSWNQCGSGQPGGSECPQGWGRK